jgi:hypothetical protein
LHFDIRHRVARPSAGSGELVTALIGATVGERSFDRRPKPADACGRKTSCVPVVTDPGTAPQAFPNEPYHTGTIFSEIFGHHNQDKSVVATHNATSTTGG